MSLVEEKKSRKNLRFERKSKELIDLALKIIEKKGLSDFVMEDLAIEALYSRSTLYRYFKNKTDLLYAIGANLSKEFITYFRNTIDSTQTGLNLYRKYLKDIPTFTKQHPTQRNIWFHLVNDPNSQESSPYKASFDKLKNVIDEILEKIIMIGLEDKSINLPMGLSAQQFLQFQTFLFFGMIGQVLIQKDPITKIFGNTDKFLETYNSLLINFIA